MNVQAPRLSTLVVGVDGSSNSLAAVRWAAELAGALGARVVAVHAMGLLERTSPGSPPSPAEPQHEIIERLFAEEWCEPLAERSVSYGRVLQYGPPVQVLLQVAEDEDADLIVVGSRGRGGASALLLGSTSSQVANRSTCPVTIVPNRGGDAR